jgi:hypothetical protein
MQPQTFPTPSYPPVQAQPPQQKRGNGGKVVLWIFIGIIMIGLAAGGVYLWQQTRIDSLANSNADLTTRLANAQSANSNSASTTTFGESKVPFTFTYPSDWVLGSDAPILADKDLPVSYSITLLAPGTVNTQTLANGSNVSAGAIINIAILPATTQNVKDVVPKVNGATPTITDLTVSNSAGIQYQITDNGATRIYTDVIKNKVEYRISFEAKGDLKSNQYYGAYTALLNSFKLK